MGRHRTISFLILGLVALSFAACTNRGRGLQASTVPTNPPGWTPGGTNPQTPITTNNNNFTCTVQALRVPQDFLGVARLQDPNNNNQWVNGLVFRVRISTNVQTAVVDAFETMPENKAFTQDGNFSNVFLIHQPAPGTPFRLSYRLKRTANAQLTGQPNDPNVAVCASPVIDYRAIYAQLQQAYGSNFPNLDNPNPSNPPPVFDPEEHWDPNFHPADYFPTSGIATKIVLDFPSQGLTLNCIQGKVKLANAQNQQVAAGGTIRIKVFEVTDAGNPIDTMSVFLRSQQACNRVVSGQSVDTSDILHDALVFNNGDMEKSVWYVGLNAHTAHLRGRQEGENLQEGQDTINIVNDDSQSVNVKVRGEDCPSCDFDANDVQLNIRGLMAATNAPGKGLVFEVLRNETFVLTAADTRSTSGCSHAIQVEHWERNLNLQTGAISYTYKGVVFNVANDHVPNPGSMSFSVKMGDQLRVRWKTVAMGPSGCSVTTNWQYMDGPLTYLGYRDFGDIVEGSTTEVVGNHL